MLTGENDFYYALTLYASGTNISAYYSLTPDSNLQISQGGVTFTPTAAASTLANIYPTTLQVQSPPGTMNAGVTIVTGQGEISGRVNVSPAVDVPVVITAYGAGGKQLGQTIMDAGATVAMFAFPVDAASAIPPGEVGSVLKRITAEH